MSKYLLSTLLMLAVLPSCYADDAPTGRAPRAAPTVTRQIKQFGDLEYKLIEGINAKDVAAVSRLLTDDFILRTGNNPGDITPRAEAIEEMVKGGLPSGLDSFAAFDYGNVVNFSFVWNVNLPETDTRAHRIFVIDTWRMIDGNWKLAVRHASAAGKGDANVPGAISHPNLAPGKKI